MSRSRHRYSQRPTDGFRADNAVQVPGNNHYSFDVDIDKQIWSDMSLMIRFGRIQHEMNKATDGAPQPTGNAEADAINNEQYENEVYELMVRFEDLMESITAMIDRCATIKRNGQRIQANDTPKHVIHQVMTAMRSAQAEARDPGN